MTDFQGGHLTSGLTLLSAQHFYELRRAGLPVCVPNELPGGFVVEGVDAEMDEDFGGSYRVHFRGPGNQTLLVQAAAGGVGDVFRGESREYFTHPIFGDGVVEFYEPGTEEVDFRSHWMHGADEFPVFSVAGSGFSGAEAVYIARSLRLLEQ